jgi:hypothetical protein
MLWPPGIQHQASMTRNSECGSVGWVCKAPQGHGVGMLVLDWGRCCGLLACNIRPWCPETRNVAQSVWFAKPCRGTVQACWCWIGVYVVASWHTTSGLRDPKLGIRLGRLCLQTCWGTVQACWCWIGVVVVASWHTTSGLGDPKLGMWLGRLGLQSPAGVRCRHVGVGLGSMLWPPGIQHQAPVTRNS